MKSLPLKDNQTLKMATMEIFRGLKRQRSPESDSFIFAMNNTPDRSMMDFYCKLCEAHMNSAAMWESHITGKRHMKNAKKEPGERLSKIRAVTKENVKSFLDALLDYGEGPFVGLKFMMELQRTYRAQDALYTCYLCQGNFTQLNVVGHIISMKHRLNYLKVASSNDYNLINNLNLAKEAKASLLAEKVMEIEAAQGCGHIKVKVGKGDDISLLVDRYAEDEGCPRKRQCTANSHHAAGDGDCLRMSDIKNLSVDSKLQLLEQLSAANISNSNEFQVAVDSLETLSDCLLKYKLENKLTTVM